MPSLFYDYFSAKQNRRNKFVSDQLAKEVDPGKR